MPYRTKDEFLITSTAERIQPNEYWRNSILANISGLDIEKLSSLYPVKCITVLNYYNINSYDDSSNTKHVQRRDTFWYEDSDINNSLRSWVILWMTYACKCTCTPNRGKNINYFFERLLFIFYFSPCKNSIGKTGQFQSMLQRWEITETVEAQNFPKLIFL